MNNTIKKICDDKDFEVLPLNDGRVITRKLQKHKHSNNKNKNNSGFGNT